MEAVIRIFRITDDFIVRPSHSDQETVTLIQERNKEQNSTMITRIRTILYHIRLKTLAFYTDMRHNKHYEREVATLSESCKSPSEVGK